VRVAPATIRAVIKKGLVVYQQDGTHAAR